MGSIGIVGGGQMGAGIAEVMVRHGLPVQLVEASEATTQAARERVQRSLDRAVEKGKTSADAAAQALSLLNVGTDWEALSAATFVIEAVPEQVELKTSVFRRVSTIAPAAVLASNTSSIPIARLAAAAADPGRVIGMHFFHPVPVMRLVEVVPAISTTTATIEATEQLAARLECSTIRSADRAGFIVNTLLMPYLMSAIRMLEDGHATADDIDAGMVRGCGHPMGPLALADFIGLDTCLAIAESLYEEYGDPSMAPPPLLRRMVDAGLLGRKSGRGFREH